MTESEKIETVKYILTQHPNCCHCSLDRIKDEKLKEISNNEWTSFVKWLEYNNIGQCVSGMQYHSPSIMLKDEVHLFLEQKEEDEQKSEFSPISISISDSKIESVNTNCEYTHNIDSRGVGNTAIDNSKNKSTKGLLAKIFRWVVSIFKK